MKGFCTAAKAFQTVLTEAGSSLKKDAVDLCIMGYLKSIATKGAIFKLRPMLRATGGEVG